MRQLLILRHAKSDWSNKLRDFDRPLAARGLKNAKQMGLWMHQQNLLPDYIISSPAKRTLQTAELVTEPFAINVSEIHLDSNIYEANLRDLLNVLAQIPNASQRVLLVGHNPGFDQLLSHLADIAEVFSGDGRLMTTCTLAYLDMPEDWEQLSPGCARLVKITRAKNLKL